jgi:hypothetical protein
VAQFAREAGRNTGSLKMWQVARSPAKDVSKKARMAACPLWIPMPAAAASPGTILGVEAGHRLGVEPVQGQGLPGDEVAESGGESGIDELLGHLSLQVVWQATKCVPAAG